MFAWWQFWKRSRTPDDPLLEDKLMLLEELRAAQMEWMHAQKRLDYVLGKDQIDYAIFALEAAEKKYDMLLKRAKTLNLHLLEIGDASKKKAAGES